jgi:hypothetical protein
MLHGGKRPDLYRSPRVVKIVNYGILWADSLVRMEEIRNTYRILWDFSVREGD